MTARLTLFAALVLLGVGCGPGATELDMQGKGLQEVPEKVWSMTDLEWLDISHNALRGALPAEIRKLQQLRTLDASDNLMTGVPAEIGQLANLKLLDLSNNQLTGLPYELANLTQLERLDLRGNDVSEADLAVIREQLTTTEILW